MTNFIKYTKSLVEQYGSIELHILDEGIEHFSGEIYSGEGRYYVKESYANLELLLTPEQYWNYLNKIELEFIITLKNFEQ